MSSIIFGFADIIFTSPKISAIVIFAEVIYLNRIKELRLKRGMKQTELAAILSVAQSTVSAWESGRYEPDMQALVKIAGIMGTTVDCIVGGAEVPVAKVETSGVMVPVLGDVAAGIPIDAIQNVIDYEEIDAAMAATGEYLACASRAPAWSPASGRVTWSSSASRRTPRPATPLWCWSTATAPPSSA